MKNINRDFLVTVDAKTAAIKAPKGMSFYITDVHTCNIFFKLEFGETDSLIDEYAPEEDASNYKLILRVLKPNKDQKEIVATLLNDKKGNNFFIADLTREFTDYLGIYECELFIESNINNQRTERSTTDRFEYEVKESIFSVLNDIIEGDPNYPLLADRFATKDFVLYSITNLDLYGYATREYVNQVLVGGDVDLSEYITNSELEEALSDVVNNVDLSEYATKAELESALENMDLTEYAKKSEIPTSLPANGGNADTVDGYSIWIGSQEAYDALETLEANTLYFVEEEV